MNRIIIDESPGAIAGGVPQTQPPPLAPAVRTAPAPEPVDPDVEASPEYQEAKKAAAALSRKANQIAQAKAERLRIAEEHRRLSAALDALRVRVERGAREAADVDRLAEQKHREAEEALGSPAARPGLALDRIRQFLELSAAADALREILTALREQIAAQAAAVEAFAKEHGI